MADHRLESERIEALKLVRCFVTTKEGMQHISDSVLRAVIAIAEQTDEKLRNACLETLGEMGNSVQIHGAKKHCLSFQDLPTHCPPFITHF
jgi:mannitol/fructose-specific phosphotransferase system IIA component